MSHKWMRQGQVNILDYLPAFLAKSKHFKNANDADSREHETIRLDLQDLLDQCYVDSATWGLPIWEDLVGITTPTKGYVARRAAVKARLQATYSVTLTFVNDLVNQYVVNNSAVVVDVPSDYRIDIMIHDGQVVSWADMLQALRIWLPAHIGYKIIAQTGTAASIYAGAVVSVCDVYNIEAQSDYGTPEPETANTYTAVAISVADVINIEADIYR